MKSVKEAKNILEQHIHLAKPVNLFAEDALGMILSENIISKIDVPSFDNSAMDGYAIRFEEKLSSYKITQHIPAGEISEKGLKQGEAARIFTGAPVPQGADTVIQQELVSTDENLLNLDLTQVKKFSNVRYKGEQCKSGDVIARSGDRLTPGMIALLASVGINQVNVYSPPSVGVIVTGSELQEPGAVLRNGEIYNSNAPAVRSYLKLSGIDQFKSYSIKDDPIALKEKMVFCMANYDLLILTGGISVGEYDFVESILMEVGVKTLFYKVKQKPGKPLYAGMSGKKFVFGLPGNPAAAITCFNQYVRPCLMGMMGMKNTFDSDAQLPMAHDWKKKGELTNILKARVEGGKVRLLNGQESFNLLPFAEADCFVLIDENVSHIKEGDLVDVYYW